MLRPFEVPRAVIDWSDPAAPVAEQFGDTYFSRDGGLHESRYLFIEQTRLGELLGTRPTVTVSELGFGTGLNFLLSWKTWRDRGSKAILDYVSYEKYPLCTDDLRRALEPWQELAPLSAQLIDDFPPLVPGFIRLLFEGGLVSLTLLIGDAADLLAEVDTPADIWFLDGFAPVKNPDLWSQEIFSHVSRLSKPGTVASSFTSASEVRRLLSANGFTVEKIPGFGRKRESIRAEFSAPQSDLTLLPPWKALPPIQTRRDGHVAVIGGGLAGYGAAWALCARGFSVTLLDAARDGFGGASGNPAGIFSPYIAREQNWATDLYLSSFIFSRNRILALEKTIARTLLHRSGSVQFAHTPRLSALAAAFDSLGIDPLLATVGEGSPSQITFPLAGWISPRALGDAVRETCAGKLSVKYGSTACDLEHSGECWKVSTEQGESFECDIIILASAYQSSNFNQSTWLPLEPIRGEIIWAAGGSSRSDAPVQIGRGYVLPTHNNNRIIGASYAHGRRDLAPIAAEQQTLLSLAQQLDSSLNDASVAGGRVSFRTSTHHRLPYIGPIVEHDSFQKHFADLNRGFPSTHYSMPKYFPNLYVSAGHGSRGLLSTIAAGELLTNYICGTTALFSSSLRGELNPSSFLAKSLMAAPVQGTRDKRSD